MNYSPIGTLRSDFHEKFGVPRQSGMVPDARAVLKLRPDPLFRAALQHLDTFSHIWILFEFHQHLRRSFTPTIRPPRIDAPNRVGVFASRSPDRPNPIGLSAVKLERIDLEAPGGIELHLSGVDLLDGTPVLDIKPYLPYADRIDEATGGWAGGEIRRYEVRWSEAALASAGERDRRVITQILEWDPRPTSQRESMPIDDPAHEGRSFAFRFGDHDVRWRIEGGAIQVFAIDALPSGDDKPR